MSRELKAIVLAKCETCKTSQGGWMPVGSDHSGLACEYFREDGYGYFQIGSVHHAICLKFNDETHSESAVWPIAAQVLGIQEAKPEPRPSNALLWEAFQEAKTVDYLAFGHLVARQAREKNREQFERWLATLPDDPLEADKAAVLKEFANGLERSLIDAYCTGDAINAIKRFAGMEVKNSSNALEQGRNE